MKSDCISGSKAPLVSIVVPVFNIESNIRYCFESLVRQTYANIEIILVDDGSTDNSALVCRGLVSRSSKAKLVSKPNGGLGSARNWGMRHAEGEYCMFVDGDDILAENCVEKLLNAILETGATMAMGSMRQIASYSEKLAGEYRSETIFEPEEALVAILYGTVFDVSGCCKMAKTSFWLSNQFPEKMFYEDLCVVGRNVKGCSAIVAVAEPMYGYYMRPGSITSKKIVSKQQCRDYFNSIMMLQESVAGCGKKVEDALLCRSANEYARLFRFADYYAKDNEFANMREEIVHYSRKHVLQIFSMGMASTVTKLRVALIAVLTGCYSAAYYFFAKRKGKRLS